MPLSPSSWPGLSPPSTSFRASLPDLAWPRPRRPLFLLPALAHDRGLRPCRLRRPRPSLPAGRAACLPTSRFRARPRGRAPAAGSQRQRQVEPAAADGGAAAPRPGQASLGGSAGCRRARAPSPAPGLPRPSRRPEAGPDRGGESRLSGAARLRSPPLWPRSASPISPTCRPGFSPPGSAGAWRWPGSSPAGHRSGCWTSRPMRSTPRPRRCSPRRWPPIAPRAAWRRSRSMAADAPPEAAVLSLSLPSSEAFDEDEGFVAA